jgi:hypothetical protein
MNIGHAFQYRLNLSLEALFVSDFTYALYPSIVTNNSSFQAYTIVYFVINFIAFLEINTWVEAALVLKMHREIAEKRAQLAEEIRFSRMNNSAGSEVVNKVIRGKQKRLIEDAKKDTRAVKMVVTNSAINFLLRLPEILVFFSSDFAVFESLLLSSKTYLNTIFLSSFDSMLVSVSYLLYILTFTTNVLIYCLFNTKFKQYFTLW